MADCSRVNIAFAGPRPSDSASATIYQCPHQNTEGPGNDVELPSLPAALNAAPCSEQGTSKTSKLAVSIPAPREDKKEENVQETVSAPCNDVDVCGGRVIVPKSSKSFPVERLHENYNDIVENTEQPVGHKIEDSPNVGDEIVTETANQEDDILENVNSEDSIQDSDNSKHSKRDRVGLKHSRQMSAVMEGSRRSSTTGSLLTEIQDVAEIVQQNENNLDYNLIMKIWHGHKRLRYAVCAALLLICMGSLASGIWSAVFYHPTTKQNEIDNCTEYYILSGATVECGRANSHNAEEITVRGVKKFGDTDGVMKVWLKCETDIDFVSQLQHPVSDGGYAYKHTQQLLQGWQRYTWEHSTISGYCEIINNGPIEQHAILYVFVTNEDAQNFNKRGVSRNAILTDNITIAPNESQFFRKWGPQAPLHVRQSSYHYFGIDISADMNFTSNITVTQMSVNTSNYGPPIYVSSSNSTYFPLSPSAQPDNDIVYVAICELLPSSLQGSNGRRRGTLTLSPGSMAITRKNCTYTEEELVDGAEQASHSLHICSCNVPKLLYLRTPMYVFIVKIGSFLIFFLSLGLLLTIFTHYLIQKIRNHHGDYDVLH